MFGGGGFWKFLKSKNGHKVSNFSVVEKKSFDSNWLQSNFLIKVGFFLSPSNQIYIWFRRCELTFYVVLFGSIEKKDVKLWRDFFLSFVFCLLLLSRLYDVKSKYKIYPKTAMFLLLLLWSIDQSRCIILLLFLLQRIKFKFCCRRWLNL